MADAEEELNLNCFCGDPEVCLFFVLYRLFY